jgi:hypothetical protein
MTIVSIILMCTWSYNKVWLDKIGYAVTICYMASMSTFTGITKKNNFAVPRSYFSDILMRWGTPHAGVPSHHANAFTLTSAAERPDAYTAVKLWFSASPYLPDIRIMEHLFFILFILQGSDVGPINGNRIWKISFEVICVNLNKFDCSWNSKFENGPFWANKLLLENKALYTML